MQELIAPVVVKFYSVDQQCFRDKRSLEQTLHEVTGIPIRALQGDSLTEFDFDTRILWSKKRVTFKAEDKAYSLLGLLGLSMPLIYGEGEKAAFRRLRREYFDQTSLTQNPQLEASIDQCLAHLRLSDPRDDRSRIMSAKGGLLKDAYRWVLEYEDFQQWRGDSDSHLLWIKGDPGKGKTMLLCGVIKELSCASVDQCFVSYFFCQATDTSLNNAIAVLRGLIYMLVRQDRSLAKHLYEEWKIAGQRLFEDVNAWDALTRIFTSMIQDNQHSKLVFVIDALDECVNNRAKLLDFITRQSQTGQAKWLVSSRNWLEVEERLEIATRKVRLSLELNATSISAAVKIYIRHQVDELQRSKNLDHAKRNEIMEYLTKNADGTFLWVALVCERLRPSGVRARHIMQELRCYPSGLDSLYDRMIQYIDNSLDSELCREILSIVAVTYRPLSVVELAVLIESEPLPLAELREVIESCGSFLTIREDVVYFVHQSAKEFLTRSTAGTIFPSGVGPKHVSVFMSSIRALSQGLRRDMYNLHKPGVAIGQVQPPSPDPLAPLRYSCIFWIDHMVEGCSLDKPQCQEHLIGLVYQLLREKFLYWLEALSLIGDVPSVFWSIAKLFPLVQDNENGKSIAGLFHDIYRILHYYRTSY
ncbi:putative Beta transducin-like protein HET-E2C*40 [Seiridium unicorne]|uniref:Beta transducin-like protein HET-E2C*40 n=1 Tax=Seiridium unicorne TaxID=138068 RepID=A0ABR2VG47_9PEZI